jgi:hypothetical protein
LTTGSRAYHGAVSSGLLSCLTRRAAESVSRALPRSDHLMEPNLTRKPNYGFEKRKKELDRQAKKNEKLRRKREDANERSDERATPPAEEERTPPSEEG